MKMKNVFSLKSLAVAMVAGVSLLASCSKNSAEYPLGGTDSQNVNSEAVSSNATDETADMSNAITYNITDSQYGTGARIAAGGVVLPSTLAQKDVRLTGATVTIYPDASSTKDNPLGYITIDFGSGVTDPHGITRKGLITITYNGKKGVAGSTRIITFTNYSRSTQTGYSVSFDNNMTYTITNVTDSTDTGITFHHVLNDGTPGTEATLTFSKDNTTYTRTADYNVVFNFSAKTLTLQATDAAHSASGTNRKGYAYTMDITNPIVYSRACVASNVFIPVSGIQNFTVAVSNLVTIDYSIDYGDGTCDNTATVTYGGKTVTITANSSGN